jgi:NAD+ synthase
MRSTISKWIKDYTINAGLDTLVVGVSGGIDSAVVSTLCADTNMRTIVVTMPIRQKPGQDRLGLAHVGWLQDRYKNVEHRRRDLTPIFDSFEELMSPHDNSQLGFANSRSRLRMVTLYQIAQSQGGLVVGTGNKVEDFGIGFYTKYGDGGVDISPIAGLMKTQVWNLGRDMGIMQEIIDAAPTDGLWDDGREDQDQLGGLSYADLERAMLMDESGKDAHGSDAVLLETYRKIRTRNLHKMLPIPVFNP